MKRGARPMTKEKSHPRNIFSLSGLYNFVRGNQLSNFMINTPMNLRRTRAREKRQEFYYRTRRNERVSFKRFPR